MIQLSTRGALRGTSAQSPVDVYLAGLQSDASIRTMSGKLDAVAKMLGVESAHDVPWHTIRAEHMQALTARLSGRYAPATANAILAAIRGVLRAAWALGMMDREALERAIRGPGGRIYRVRGNTRPRGQHVPRCALDALYAIAAEQQGPRALRDLALLAVLDGGGLRRAEVAALDVADVDLDTESLRVRSGKGRKFRVVPLASGAGRYLSDWIGERTDGPLFVAIDRYGCYGDRLTARGVGYVISSLAEQAGIDITPHDFRRTMAGELLELGADVGHVQKIMGHSSPRTTLQYDRRPELARRAAARLRAI